MSCLTAVICWSCRAGCPARRDVSMIAVHGSEQCRLRGVGSAGQILDAGLHGRQGLAGNAVMMAAQQQVH